MTDLNEKLKFVAQYTGAIGVAESGYRPSEGVYKPYKFHTDYNEQIPVWQKVFSELMIFRKILDKNSFNQKVEDIDLITFNYKVAIFKGTPLESFEILVQAIQFINKMKK